MKIKDILTEMSAPMIQQQSKRQQGDFNTVIAGMPCQILITYAHKQKPNSRADNPDDYYGYTDFEFDVLDRKGYPAPWLEQKMTDQDRARIEQEYFKIVDDKNNDDRIDY